MKFIIHFLVVFLILLQCTSIVKAQVLHPYKSVNINCRVPAKLERIRKTLIVKDKSETIQIDTLYNSVVISCFTDELEFTLPNFIALYSKKSKTNIVSIQINGHFLDDFKYLNAEITYLKTVYSSDKIHSLVNQENAYKKEEVYTNIKLSKLVGSKGGYTYKEGISKVMVSHKKVWKQKAHQEITITTKVLGIDESKFPPGIQIHFR